MHSNKISITFVIDNKGINTKTLTKMTFEKYYDKVFKKVSQFDAEYGDYLESIIDIIRDAHNDGDDIDELSDYIINRMPSFIKELEESEEY